MALFKFVKAIKKGKAIDIYNHGEMKRDFTYIDDLTEAIFRLIKCVPEREKYIGKYDSLSPIAPWRIVNIGNSNVENLMNFIKEIESSLNVLQKISFLCRLVMLKKLLQIQIY